MFTKTWVGRGISVHITVSSKLELYIFLDRPEVYKYPQNVFISIGTQFNQIFSGSTPS